MAVYKDVDKNGEYRWRYRFMYKGKRYSGSAPKTLNTKVSAAKLEKRHQENLVARRYTGKMPKVSEFADRFLDHQKARTKPLTHKQQEATVRLYIVPSIGKLLLDEVDTEVVDRLSTEWRNQPSEPKTVNTRLGTLRRMLSLAKDWKFIPEIPSIDFLDESDSTPRWLTDAECALLLEQAEPQWRSMMLVGLRTGLRIGELRGLQWGDVDLSRRIIQVRRTDPGRRHMDATSPKGKRERTVPLTNEAHAVLSSLKSANAKSAEFVWPALLRRQGEVRKRARSEKGCWNAIARTAKKAGLEDVAWHTLRHTFASQLVMRGIPLRTIQDWLGHASITETEKYSHLAPNFGYAAANALDFPLAPETLNQPAAKALPEG
jgi:integrase